MEGGPLKVNRLLRRHSHEVKDVATLVFRKEKRIFSQQFDNTKNKTYPASRGVNLQNLEIKPMNAELAIQMKVRQFP